MPKRIQRERTKGYKLPEGAVYVGRPSKWGNPFGIAWCERGLSAIGILPADYPAAVVALYRAWLHGEITFRRQPPTREMIVAELRGKDLACWCRITLDKQYVPCHADVLLELANNMTADEVRNENLRWAERQTADRGGV